MDDHDPNAGTIGHPGAVGENGPPGLADDPPTPPATKPKRGRPRCAEETCGAISVWLPVTAQDRIIHLAKTRRQTTSEYLRDVLVQLFIRRS